MGWLDVGDRGSSALGSVLLYNQAMGLVRLMQIASGKYTVSLCKSPRIETRMSYFSRVILAAKCTPCGPVVFETRMALARAISRNLLTMLND